MINMERFEKSPKNQALHEQHKLERKLRKQELRAQGIKPGALSIFDKARIEAARERRYKEFIFKNPMAEF